jgi:hypothetical protein
MAGKVPPQFLKKGKGVPPKGGVYSGKQTLPPPPGAPPQFKKGGKVKFKKKGK